MISTASSTSPSGEVQRRREFENVGGHADVVENDAKFETAVDRLRCLSRRGGLAHAVGDEFNPDRQSAAPHVADQGRRWARSWSLQLKIRADVRGVAHEILDFNRLEHSETGRGGDRIAVQRLHGEARRVVHDFSGTDDRRKGETAAETLAEGHDVRNESFMLETMKPPRAPESHLDLVAYDENAVTCAEAARVGRRSPAAA